VPTSSELSIVLRLFLCQAPALACEDWRRSTRTGKPAQSGPVNGFNGRLVVPAAGLTQDWPSASAPESDSHHDPDRQRDPFMPGEMARNEWKDFHGDQQ
jgi:hypothetical protein